MKNRMDRHKDSIFEVRDGEGNVLMKHDIDLSGGKTLEIRDGNGEILFRQLYGGNNVAAVGDSFGGY